jgi:hypothetical protein
VVGSAIRTVTRSPLVVHRGGTFVAHCHIGDRNYGVRLEEYELLDRNSAYLLVGSLDTTD